ncbi:unnamed protein product [Caenorhabditis auriculariae]|uniref:Pre-mRNA-splicing factor RBM22 n=1 Tax=Caenorhabditis auriculariae TaxID=2777116 RepID=A0A8S1HA76_9PELO|nr:unnamed protein product [Caenorhabditis auriculariae]
MSLSKSSYTQYNRKNWEDSDFPILCETCLGNNPYLRMMKDKHGRECKICERPFTTFRWQPGKGARYKNTELCQTCAKVKNVCQTCMFDLEYGLPVQVRDHELQIADNIPKQGANRDFFLQNVERTLAQGDGTQPIAAIAENVDQAAHDRLKRLARSAPYYKRNAPHICSFFVKGECKRGEECPYRHEKPTDPDDPLSRQNIKDRYYGTNDPVAEKIINRAAAQPTLDPPADNTITTLYVGNLGLAGPSQVTQKELNDYFYQFGDVRSLRVLEQKGCAFIEYTTREAAERAAERSFNKAFINGRRLTIRWGQPQAQKSAENAERAMINPVPSVPTLPLPDGMASTSRGRDIGGVPLPPMPPIFGGPRKLVVPNVRPPTLAGEPGSSKSGVYYPSQDPTRLGAKGDIWTVLNCGAMAMLNIEAISPQMDANFNAKVLNYKIVDDGKYALYRIQITVDTYTWTVERRYSDFDAFDSVRFSDRKKSFLPPKKRLGNLDNEFLEERRLELEKYARALLELEVWYQKQRKTQLLAPHFSQILRFPPICQFISFQVFIKIEKRENCENNNEEAVAKDS